MAGVRGNRSNNYINRRQATDTSIKDLHVEEMIMIKAVFIKTSFGVTFINTGPGKNITHWKFRSPLARLLVGGSSLLKESSGRLTSYFAPFELSSRVTHAADESSFS